MIWLDRWRVRGDINGWMERRGRDIWFKRGVDAERNIWFVDPLTISKMDEWME